MVHFSDTAGILGASQIMLRMDDTNRTALVVLLAGCWLLQGMKRGHVVPVSLVEWAH
jgi:hypothetical protein